MAKQNSDSGWTTVAGGIIFGLIAVISMVPKELWIAGGIAAAAALVSWLIYRGLSALGKMDAAADRRRRAASAAEAAATRRQRDEAAQRTKRQIIDTLGEKNARLVQSAHASVQKVRDSEAARAGWLGDVDFSADIDGIVGNFRKAHELRRLADQLSALDSPTADDREILHKATNMAADLEKAAIERVRLIGECVAEAKLVDESLRIERKDAQTAEQRAELHAKLSSMLYGIGATPTVTPAESTADAVMARVQAYREIKSRIQHLNRQKL